MTSRNLQYLSEAQNRTAKALQGLLVQLRRSSGIQTTGDARRTLAALQRSRRQTESPAPTLLRTADLERVLRPLIGRTRRDPAAVARADTFPQKKQLLGTSAEVQLQAGRAIGGGEDFSRTITAVTRTAKNFGRILDQNTKALQQNREAIGAGQSLLTGVFSSQGRGGGSSALLGSGLGLVPLGLRIAGLFRKRRAEPQSFSPFELPPSLSLEVANTDDILQIFQSGTDTSGGDQGHSARIAGGSASGHRECKRNGHPVLPRPLGRHRWRLARRNATHAPDQYCPGKVAPTDGKPLPLNVLWPV